MAWVGSENWIGAALPVAAGVAGGVVGAFGSAGLGGKRAIIGFAAGAFLALGILHLIPDSAHEIGWPSALVCGLLGYTLTRWLSRRANGFCPVCTVTGEHAPQQAGFSGAAAPAEPGLGVPLLLVVGVHSVLDGLALTGAGGHGHTAELMSLALLLHKLPEGMAVAAVLRSQGRGVGASILITALVEGLTLAGVLLGVSLLNHSAWFLAGLTGAVGGSFVYLSCLTLATLMRQRLTNLLTAAAGASLLILVQVFYR